MILIRIAQAFATVAQLLPSPRHTHVFDDAHCDPAACTVCGATGIGWRERFRTWRDDMHDVFEVD